MPVQRKLPTRLSQNDVKLCDLCGTLNLNDNKECWTCRWHGGFSRNSQTIALAWQRIETLHEEVRPEHVTAHKKTAIGDFGTIRPASRGQRMLAAIAASWQRFLDQRDLRAAQRQARHQSRMPSPPDQLSI